MQGSIKCVKVAPHICLKYLIFVDDILLFREGSNEEWLEFKVILNNFFGALGMEISYNKSITLGHDILEEMEFFLKSLYKFSFGLVE